MIVLGIDPSSTSTGYGLIDHRRGTSTFVDCGCIRPKRTGDFGDRLVLLFDRMSALLSEASPDQVALESSFYGKDADAANKLGEARGVVRLAVKRGGLATTEYTPAQVKKAVAGRGQASKEQVQYMVSRLLRLDKMPRPLDASDALAVALCHIHRQSFQLDREPSARSPEVEALLKRVVAR